MISFGNTAEHTSRVLIVDDQPHNQSVLEVMLAAEGYLFVKASSGEEAIARVAQQPPDLILLDVMMPIMDGFQVARILKGNAATKHIPIIMITAADDRVARMTGLTAGAEDFLSKPVDRAELCVRVRNLLRLKSYGEYYSNYSQVLETEVRSRTADLEARTAALTENRDAQSRFRDEFFSHVSHELRSPLTAIKMFSTILADGLAGELSRRQLDCQEVVIKNVGQLEAMIDDLLQVTGLETGKLTLQRERVSISAPLNEAMSALRLPARAKGITLLADLLPDLPNAYVDRTRLRQILIILLDNAVKFTGDGGRISVAARVRPGDPGFLMISVSDNGCGVAPELAERIFERLFQVPGEPQVSRNGLGLGLYICKELVTLQGGELWLEQTQEQGSTFSFTLPVYDLVRLIGHLLEHDLWPARTAALVIVKAATGDDAAGTSSQHDWPHHMGSVLDRCLRPDMDVRLPTLRTDDGGAEFVVLAFADATGAAILARRVREQLDRRKAERPAGVIASVSYRLLPPFAHEPTGDREQVLAAFAAMLEAAIDQGAAEHAITSEPTPAASD